MAIILSFGLMLLSFLCQKRTATGVKYYGHLLGFKDFLNLAEKDRINALVEENPKYFYDLLPYAMVLGVTDKWSKRFESIVNTPPSWYSSDTGTGTFSTIVFLNTMNSMTTSMNQSMLSRPSNGGSGGGFGGGSFGGGSSGGGFGGGGGGRW